jgi:hypothetical protein
MAITAPWASPDFGEDPDPGDPLTSAEPVFPTLPAVVPVPPVPVILAPPTAVSVVAIPVPVAWVTCFGAFSTSDWIYIYGARGTRTLERVMLVGMGNVVDRHR